MTKLNDTQRTILATAGARENGLIFPIPKSLKLSAAKAEPVLQKMLAGALVTEQLAADGEIVWRADDENRKLALVVTAAGLKAIGIEPSESQKSAGPSVHDGKQGKSTAQPRTKSKQQSSKVRTETAVSTLLKPATKLGQLVAALRTRKGATIEDLMTTTGWQAHSIRGAISGALKKKQGLNVVSAPIDGRGRVYRIAE